MDYFELLKAIPIIIASGVAVYGINSWRRELRGKRKLELAEETLALFYEAKDVLNYMRFPGAYGFEGSSREAINNESNDLKRVRDNAYVLVERYQDRKETFNKLQAIRYRFMAVFGFNSGKPFEELQLFVNRLFLSARRLERLWSENIESNRSGKSWERRIKSIEEEEKIFWETSDENDETKIKLNNIIKDIEMICNSILLGNTKSKLFENRT